MRMNMRKNGEILLSTGSGGGNGLVAQLCPTLETPWTVCSPPCSSVHGIL